MIKVIKEIRTNIIHNYCINKIAVSSGFGDGHHHRTQTESHIEAPLPEIFTINLEWPEDKTDTAASILRILFAIPEVWHTRDLYVVE